MARMPQIPQPSFEGRPGGGLVGREMPDDKSFTGPLDDAARATSGMGDHFEALQTQRDEAQAKLQKVVDDVTATRMAGDHSEKANNLFEQLREQFNDTPEKLPEEYKRQLREMTDAEIKAAPNQQVALDIAQKYAVQDNQHTTSAHSWMILRMTQKAKSDLAAMASSSIRAAQSQTSVQGLAMTVKSALATLEPHIKQLHGDPDEARQSLKRDMAAAWVESNGPDNPVGVSLALDQAKKGGPLADLTPEQYATYQKRAPEWVKGYGERERFQVSKEAVALNNKIGNLFIAGQLDSKNAFQMKDSLEKKMDAIESNPQYRNNPEEKEAQKQIVQMQLDGLKYLREAAEKPGRFDPVFDTPKVSAILDRFDALGKPGAKGPKDLLQIVELQRDIARAQADRWIPPGYASTMVKSLSQMTGKAIDREAKNTGWGISFLGFGGRSPQQAGNVVQNNYFKGDNKAFGKLTLEQQNQARIDYLGQIVDAQENERNLDVKSAEEMAFAAIKNVSGRAGKPR